MPIIKGSSMMSLGTWKARSTRYQRFLNLSNVFLLIVSTILLFSAGILMNFYHLTKLDFWSWYFYACPNCMLFLGLYTFAVSVYGFLISSQESRGLISMIAIFLGIAFFIQIFSVFTALELRNRIQREAIPTSKMDKNMRQFNVDDTITDNWNIMQTNLRCCGGQHYETGFNDWDTIMNGNVPDSCCHKVSPGCGRDKIAQGNLNQNREMGIWKDGCLEILHQKLIIDVVPMLLVYSGVGVLLAVVELITVVLACAYVAQINRRRRRAATANDEEYLPSLTSKHETNF